MINCPFYVDEGRRGLAGSQRLGTHRERLRAPDHRVPAADRPADVADGRGLEAAGRAGRDRASSARKSVTWLGVPLQSEGKTLGALVVQSYREETVAHRGGQGAADLRRPTHRLCTRAHAADRRDPPAQRRALPHQRRPARPGDEPRHAGDVRPGRRPAPGDLRRAGRRHRRSGRGGRAHPLPVHDRERRPVPRRADGRLRVPQARPRDPRAAAHRGHHAGASGRVRPARASSRGSPRSPRSSCRWSSEAGRPG